MVSNLIRGRTGEELGRDYLHSKGYSILETNYKNKIGEIDLIAMDKDILVFIEVKTRTSTSYGYAFEAVNLRKQKKIIHTSMLYIKYKNFGHFQLRYDIIEVYLMKDIKINHLINAFCL
ncbi:YraN family protein [Tissierella creatinini]|nr:YraN family protein [Tissierella creatinini]TJX69168.1 YraN family protein [Soehngenia saccharolytica]